LIAKGTIKLLYISSNLMTADRFMKALAEPKFKEFCNFIEIVG
jgi:hypothetical protein